jgi:glycosyltransferase involved in cell wall biosynthesis
MEVFMTYLKVLVVATTNFELDGITHVIMNYYMNIDKSKIKFDFIVHNKITQRLAEEIESNNSKIFQLPDRKKHPLNYVKKLKEVLQYGKYHIIHAHGNSGTLFIEMFVAKLCGVKVRIAHGHNSTSDYKISHYILKPFMLKCLTHSFACSHKAGKWLFGSNYIIINNGIDLDRYAFDESIREEYRKRLNITDKIVIGHIGHFSYQKNHEFLIDVFNEVHKNNKNYVLLLLGDGSLRKEIEEKVQLLGLTDSVIFMGESLEAPNLLQSMDILVFPSRFEGLPLTLVEAQASCLPCIVSINVSPESKLTDLVQFVSLSESGEYWAQKVLKIETIDRNAIRQNILFKIENAGYSIKQNAEFLKKLYISLGG